jgi:hypothetical protein
MVIASSILRTANRNLRRNFRNFSTMAKQVITVFGATGSQGGSVVEIFLNDAKLKNDWQVRGVTRDATKESAKKLEARGVEMVSVSVIPPLEILPSIGKPQSD